MPDPYAIYHLTASLLTPLHIGNGNTLLHEYDYAVYGRKTWRINDSAFLEAQNVDDPAYVEMLALTPPGQLLRDADFQPDSPFIRYVIQGHPRSQKEGAQLQEQLKDVFDRPYLPGSSVKGALRTALAWQVWHELRLRPSASELTNSPRFAAQNYERRLFVQADARRGREPNYDLLRALQVSDSQPVSTEQLMLINVSVLNQSGTPGAPIEMEAVRPDTSFELTVKLDLALFSNWARKRGLKMPFEQGLRDLPEIINQRTRERIQEEANWYKGVPGADRLLGFYQQLLRVSPGANQFLLQLGWGAGWDDKTLGSRLKESSNFMEYIIDRYNLARGKHRVGKPFPASRRVIVGQGNEPVLPLGWVLMTFEPQSAVSRGWGSAKAPARTAERAPLPAHETPAPGQTQRQSSSQPPAAAPAASPAVKPAPAAPQPAPILIDTFTSPPTPGQRFRSVAYSVDGDQVLFELPGLSGDEWMGVAPAAGRRWREKDRLICEVVAVRPDPDSPGCWLVDCKIQPDRRS